MDCKAFSDLLDNYANLTKDEISMLEEHAAVCESCGKELEFFKSIINVTASLPQAEPPADLLDRINDEIDRQSKPLLFLNKVYYNVKANVKQYSTVAACLLVGLVVGLNNGSISNMLHHEPTNRNTDAEPSVSENYKPSDFNEPVSSVEEEIEHNQAAPSTTEAVVSAFPPKLPVTGKLSDKTDKTNTTAVALAPAINPALSGFSSSYPVKREPISGSSKKSTYGNSYAASNPASPNTQKPAATEYTMPSLPATEAPVSTPYQSASYNEEPVQNESSTDEVTATPSIENYTLARGAYSIQEDEYAYTEPEPTPDDTIGVDDYAISTESLQVALADTSSKDVVYDKLFILQGDISTVFEIIGNYNVSYVDSHYEASLSEFHEFLSSLDNAGIYYSYTCMRGEEATVWFTISK